MKIKYQIKNISASAGQYFLNGNWHTLKGGEAIVLETPPSKLTKNVIKTEYEDFSDELESPVEEKETRKKK